MNATFKNQNTAARLIADPLLAKFNPGRRDNESMRILDLKNPEGHPELRVVISNEEIQLIAFTGTVSQTVQWIATFDINTPLAVIKAAIIAAS